MASSHPHQLWTGHRLQVYLQRSVELKAKYSKSKTDFFRCIQYMLFLMLQRETSMVTLRTDRPSELAVVRYSLRSSAFDTLWLPDEQLPVCWEPDRDRRSVNHVPRQCK